MYQKNFSKESLVRSSRKLEILVWSYRKLEILLLIYEGVNHVKEMWRLLPIGRQSIYKLLKRYRTQRLVKAKRETVGQRSSLHYELTDKGFKWMRDMLQEEHRLLDEEGLDIVELYALYELVDRMIMCKAREKKGKNDCIRTCSINDKTILQRRVVGWGSHTAGFMSAVCDREAGFWFDLCAINIYL